MIDFIDAFIAFAAVVILIIGAVCVADFRSKKSTSKVDAPARQAYSTKKDATRRVDGH